MDEDTSSKEALRIAIRILRERCNTFQKRIAVLEGENAAFKSELQLHEPNECSLTEIDTLKQRIASAEEQNGFLLNKMKIISQENLQLWSNLGKLTHANKSLGLHLNKINDSLSQHANNHQPLIRSKTFTQERPTVNDSPEKLNGKEDKLLELEDVSLKLISNLTDVQNEVDSLASLSEDLKNVAIFDNVITSSLGSKSDSDVKGDDFNEELKLVIDELNFARDESVQQNKMLKEMLQHLKNNKESQVSFETKNDTNEEGVPKMCPICSQQFPKEMAFSAFVNHVESHFISQDE